MKSEFERSSKLIVNFDTKRLDETIKYAGFTFTRRSIFMLMADHVTHHWAQMLGYMRLKGLVPLKYWEFQYLQEVIKFYFVKQVKKIYLIFNWFHFCIFCSNNKLLIK